jgi:hypothetical protein
MKFISATTLVIVLGCSNAAAQLCDAVALESVEVLSHYTKKATPSYKKGDAILAIIDYEKNPKTGLIEYGFYRDPENYIVGNRRDSSGKLIPTVKLLDCYIDNTGKLKQDRKRTEESKLRMLDLDYKLTFEYNMCSACASNAMSAYFENPSQGCGKIVRNALEGNIEAQHCLKNPDDPKCSYVSRCF